MRRIVGIPDAILTWLLTESKKDQADTLRIAVKHPKEL